MNAIARVTPDNINNKLTLPCPKGKVLLYISSIELRNQRGIQL